MKKSTSVKHLVGALSLISSALVAHNAHALLVDNSQQKVVYIGKGSDMQAVRVNEIRNTTVAPSVSYQNSADVQYQSTYAQPSQEAYHQTYQSYQNQNAQSYNTQSYNTQSYQTQPTYQNYNTNYQNFNFSVDNLDRLAISTKSASVAVFDLQTGEPIYAKNINARRSIASITKMMTAMVLMDAGLNLSEEITLISSDLVGAKKASTNLHAGDRMTRSEFILLMLMKSENPAAKALARTYPGGYDAFISAMNQKAQSLGMSQTSFADSSGLNPRNVSSASDLVKMMQAINSNPQYDKVRSYSTVARYDFYINNHNRGPRTYKANNTSRLVRAGEHPIGASKTGYIREAGYCYVMETHVNNRPAVVVLLGAGASDSRWSDAETILTQLAYLH